MSKHTPGPWTAKYIPTSVGGCLKIEPINACLYADGMHPYASQDSAYDEIKANAKLIAAAPKMLTALEKIHAMIGTGTNTTNTIITSLAIEAIKEAGGEL